MQNAALEALGRPERYCRLHVPAGEIGEAVPLLQAAGFLGVNLTIPHKTDVLPFLTGQDDHARKLGAVNTVAFRGPHIIGRNTDGPGILRAIAEDLQVDPATQRTLILGAGGGAGRAIATQFSLLGSPGLILLNRTYEKAATLARALGATAIPWSEEALADSLPQIDLIINASSVGMKHDDPSPIPVHFLTNRHLIYDTVYVGSETPLQRAASAAGARSANGVSLLLHQGALSLEFWLGQPAPLDSMRQALHAARKS